MQPDPEAVRFLIRTQKQREALRIVFWCGLGFLTCIAIAIVLNL